MQQVVDVADTVDLPLQPWHGAAKRTFVRIVPVSVTGRRFPVAGPEAWHSAVSDVRRSSED